MDRSADTPQPRGRRTGADARGQSEPFAAVLLVLIGVAGATAVVMFGGAALDAERQSVTVGSAEHAMTQFDSKASLVAHGSSGAQRISLVRGTDGGTTVNGDAGWLNMTIRNGTTDAIETPVMNVSLGAVVYRNGGTTIAYQGGGVWKRTADGGSTMVSPPEFHYRVRKGKHPTLTMPLVVVEGEGSLGNRAVVRSGGPPVAMYPMPNTPDRSNPLTGGVVEITVNSDYYRAWGRFFEERTGGTVRYDHAAETVTIELVTPAASPGVEGGIISGATSETLSLSPHARADSYDSRLGDYDSTQGDHTRVVSSGDVEVDNHGLLEGSLEAGGSVTLSNHAVVTGNVSYGGALGSARNADVGGWIARNASVDPVDPVDWLIDDKRERFNESSDDAAAIEDRRLVDGQDAWTLPAGDYYLSELSLGSGQELVLDTTGNETVEVVVDDDLTLDGGATLRVVGNGTARLYVEGSTVVGGGANVSVPDHRATGLWIYMNPGRSARFDNGARFVGTIYGPGTGASGGVDIDLENHVSVYGGLVGSVDDVPNHAGIHFDQALAEEDPLAGYAADVPLVTYLHTSINYVTVTED